MEEAEDSVQVRVHDLTFRKETEEELSESLQTSGAKPKQAFRTDQTNTVVVV